MFWEGTQPGRKKTSKDRWIKVVREGGNCEANIGKEVGEGDENGTQIKKDRLG